MIDGFCVTYTMYPGSMPLKSEVYEKRNKPMDPTNIDYYNQIEMDDPRSQGWYENILQPDRDMKDIDRYCLVTAEERKMKKVQPDTYALYPGSMPTGNDVYEKRQKPWDSEFIDYYNQLKIDDPRSVGAFQNQLQPGPDLRDIDRYCIPSPSTEDSIPNTFNFYPGKEPSQDEFLERRHRMNESEQTDYYKQILTDIPEPYDDYPDDRYSGNDFEDIDVYVLNPAQREQVTQISMDLYEEKYPDDADLNYEPFYEIDNPIIVDPDISKTKDSVQHKSINNITAPVIPNSKDIPHNKDTSYLLNDIRDDTLSKLDNKVPQVQKKQESVKGTAATIMEPYRPLNDENPENVIEICDKQNDVKKTDKAIMHGYRPLNNETPKFNTDIYENPRDTKETDSRLIGGYRPLNFVFPEPEHISQIQDAKYITPAKLDDNSITQDNVFQSSSDFVSEEVYDKSSSVKVADKPMSVKVADKPMSVKVEEEPIVGGILPISNVISKSTDFPQKIESKNVTFKPEDNNLAKTDRRIQPVSKSNDEKPQDSPQKKLTKNTISKGQSEDFMRIESNVPKPSNLFPKSKSSERKAFEKAPNTEVSKDDHSNLDKVIKKPEGPVLSNVTKDPTPTVQHRDLISADDIVPETFNLFPQSRTIIPKVSEKRQKSDELELVDNNKKPLKRYSGKHIPGTDLDNTDSFSLPSKPKENVKKVQDDAIAMKTIKSTKHPLEKIESVNENKVYPEVHKLNRATEDKDRMIHNPVKQIDELSKSDNSKRARFTDEKRSPETYNYKRDSDLNDPFTIRKPQKPEEKNPQTEAGINTLNKSDLRDMKKKSVDFDHSEQNAPRPVKGPLFERRQRVDKPETIDDYKVQEFDHNRPIGKYHDESEFGKNVNKIVKVNIPPTTNEGKSVKLNDVYKDLNIIDDTTQTMNQSDYVESKHSESVLNVRAKFKKNRSEEHKSESKHSKSHNDQKSKENKSDPDISPDSSEVSNIDEEDSEEFQISSYKQPKDKKRKKTKHKKKKRKSSKSSKKKKDKIKEGSDDMVTSDMEFSDEHPDELNIKSRIHIEYEILLPDSSEDSEIKGEPPPIDEMAFELIINAVFDYLFIEVVDTLLICYHVRFKTMFRTKRSCDRCIPIHEIIRQMSSESGDHCTYSGCYYCQRQIARHKLENHRKGCTRIQNNYRCEPIVTGFDASSNNTRPTCVPGTVCFVCGCYFTKYSILIHENACLEKWTKRNEQLPECQRKPIPVKPVFSEEFIKENYEREKNRGNKNFKRKDAVNALLYEVSLKNHIDFDI